MEIEFVNESLTKLVERFGVSASEVKRVEIGATMFIIEFRSGAIATVDYKLSNRYERE